MHRMEREGESPVLLPERTRKPPEPLKPNQRLLRIPGSPLWAIDDIDKALGDPRHGLWSALLVNEQFSAPGLYTVALPDTTWANAKIVRKRKKLHLAEAWVAEHAADGAEPVKLGSVADLIMTSKRTRLVAEAAPRSGPSKNRVLAPVVGLVALVLTSVGVSYTWYLSGLEDIQAARGELERTIAETVMERPDNRGEMRAMLEMASLSSEALLLSPTESSWRLSLPSDLMYGNREDGAWGVLWRTNSGAVLAEVPRASVDDFVELPSYSFTYWEFVSNGHSVDTVLSQITETKEQVLAAAYTPVDATIDAFEAIRRFYSQYGVTLTPTPGSAEVLAFEADAEARIAHRKANVLISALAVSQQHWPLQVLGMGHESGNSFIDVRLLGRSL